MSWQALHAVSDRLTPSMAQAITAAFTKGQKRVPVSALLDAITRGKLTPAEVSRLMATVPQLIRTAVVGAVADAATGGAIAEQKELRRMLVGMDFEAVNPLAVSAAKKQSAQLVTRITQESQRALRSIFSTAIQSGIAPRDVARLVQTVVGLNERQAGAVLTYRGRLLDAGGKASQVNAATERYAAKLLRQRAETIARTELMDSVIRGQQAVWVQAQRDGMLPRAMEQEWLLTPDDRLCDRCTAMAGARAPVGGTFTTPYGPRTGPTLHPKCRCAVRLIIRPGGKGK